MRRLATLSLVVALGALLAACSIAPDPEPRALPASQDPLIVVNTSPPATAPAGKRTTEHLQIYYFYEGNLHSVIRTVTKPRDALSALDLALDLVSTDPSAAEVREGITTYFSPLEQQAPTVLSVDKRVATIQLDGSFNVMSGTELANAMAQIVYTIAAVPGAGINGVTFMLNGYVFPGYSPDGGTIQPPLTRADYSSLVVGGS